MLNQSGVESDSEESERPDGKEQLVGRRWWGPRPGCCLPLHTPSCLRIRPLSHLLGSLRRGVKDPRLHCQKPPGMWLRVFKGWGPGGQRGFQPHRAPFPSISSLSLSYPSLSPFFVSFLSPSLPSLCSSLSHTHTHRHSCSLLQPYQKEASCRDKGSPGTEQEELTVGFCKEGEAGLLPFTSSSSFCLHATLSTPAASPRDT